MSPTLKTTWFSSAEISISPSSSVPAIRPSSWSVRAGTFASSSPSSGCSSEVSFTDSRYESVATIRSSWPEAETSTPVRCGRVSSREAERATRLIVSTNACEGTRMVEPPGSGSFGKSSSGSVRRWNFAVPETTSTSCCDERYSSESSSFGSDRTTSSRSRPGTTAAPSRSACAGSRDAHAELHVGGLELDAAALRSTSTPGERLDRAARRYAAGSDAEAGHELIT